MRIGSTRLAALVVLLAAAIFSSLTRNDDAAAAAAAATPRPTVSGYLPVLPSGNATRMFYAYYEAASPEERAPPIVVWLQGGPGCSSMTGNFYELGPWRLSPQDMRLHRNAASWNERFGLLFLDNPVGTGFSLAARDEDIPVDQEQVVQHLSTALDAFFREQPSLRQRPLFVAGESYAGKYVPVLGHYMMKQLSGGGGGGGRGFPFRLDGLIVGNGLTDPELQVTTHAEVAYSFGLIDMEQKAQAEDRAGQVVSLVKQGDWQAAYIARTQLVDLIANVSGLATVLDVRRSVPYHCMDNGTEFLALFLNRPDVKSALGADKSALWKSCNPRVRRIMSNDTMKSVKWMVDDLLDAGVPVLLYQGLYDIKDGVVSTDVWLRTLRWKLLPEFFRSERTIWKVGTLVAGYWRTLGPLTHVIVSAAGHQVPADQPLHSQQMLHAWIDSIISTSNSS